MKWTTEAKVGLFTVLGIVLFAICIVFLGRFDIFASPSMHITGSFQSVTGLKEGNTVRFSGVKVGKVASMVVTDKGVTVTMDIDKDVKIPTDSAFTMESDGILGDKFIQITPGKSTLYLDDGSMIKGDGKSEIDKTMAQATKLMEAATTTLDSVNGIIGDAKTQAALRNALQSTELIAQNTANLTGQMNEILAENRGNIASLTANMVSITRNMESLTNQMDTNMKQFNADGQAGTEMRKIVDNLKTTTDSISKMAGAMEGVVTDPKSAADIKETLHNTAQLTNKLNRLTGGDVKAGDAGKKSDLKAQVSGEVLYNAKDAKVRTDAEVRLMMNENLYALGISNVGNGSNLDLTYGKEVRDKVYLRGGLFDGKLGLGLDVGVGSPVNLSGAFYDLHHGSYRVRSDVRLWNNTYAVGQWIWNGQHKHHDNYFGVKKVF